MERAQKTVKNVKHLLELLDSFEFVSETANRLKHEVLPNLAKCMRGNKTQTNQIKKQQLTDNIEKHLELY